MQNDALMRVKRLLWFQTAESTEKTLAVFTWHGPLLLLWVAEYNFQLEGYLLWV